MKNNIIIGFVGLGFVGGAAREAFKHHFDTEVYDLIQDKATVQSLTELATKCPVIFLALPTPIKISTGECNLSIIQNTLEELNQNSRENIVVIKSSVPPGSTKKFQEQYKNLRFVFNPEFLTERNAIEDFKNQSKVILGGFNKNVKIVKKLYNTALPNAFVHTTDFTTAEMCKFMINCALATKVSLFNEFYQICKNLSIDYDQALTLTLLDERIGASHTQVPGWDTLLGFGGSCFPANINILIHTAEKLGIDPKMLKAAWVKNLEVRPEKDWEQLEGRAIVKE
jgi:nucleotide sugar dehydrogenase